MIPCLRFVPIDLLTDRFLFQSRGCCSALSFSDSSSTWLVLVMNRPNLFRHLCYPFALTVLLRFCCVLSLYVIQCQVGNKLLEKYFYIIEFTNYHNHFKSKLISVEGIINIQHLHWSYMYKQKHHVKSCI